MEGDDNTIWQGSELDELKRKIEEIEESFNDFRVGVDYKLGNKNYMERLTARHLFVGGGAEVSVNVGDDIQVFIDAVHSAGGGSVRLANGTHARTTDLTLYSDTYLKGLGSESCIIDFGNNSAGIVVAGSGAYSTGTATATNGSTTVTGGSTVWIAGMVGQSILLGGLWYPIAARVSNTEITLAIPYAGENLSAVTYVIATVIQDVYIETLTVKNSATAAIKLQYGNEVYMSDVNIQTSTIGVDCDDNSNVNINTLDIVYCGTGIDIDNTHFLVITASGSVITTVGAGFDLTSCTNFSLNSNFVLSSATDGFRLTSCSDGTAVGCNSIKNASQGWELVSGNGNIIISNSGAASNTSDGIKLTATSDNCSISNCIIRSNGGYGINIAASTCDNNIISSIQYTSNVSGTINDSGTGTNDITANPGKIARTFTAAENITAGDGTALVTTTGTHFDPDTAGNLITGLVSYWKFNEAAGVTTADDFIGANDLTKGGSATFATGKVNNGTDLELTTSDYWAITDVAQTGLDITGDISFSCWVKLEQLPSSAGTMCIASKWISASRSWFLEIINTDKLRFAFYNDATAASTLRDSDAAVVVTGDLGNWIHFAVTADVSVPTITLYKNGAPIASTQSASNAQDIKNSTAEFNIGARSDHTEEFFDGMVDEVGVWSKILSATDIADLYFDGAGQTPKAYTVGQLLRTDASYASRANSFIGFAASAISEGSAGTVYVGGVIGGFTGLTVGSQYYLSNTTGTISTSAGTTSRKVGIAVSTTELLITNLW